MSKIWINQEVIDEIFIEGNKFLPKETGGILMGYSTSFNEFVITDIIGPGENAIHKSTSFQPDQTFHEKEIARIYKASCGLTTYLGDWHTHPNSFPYLSPKDKATIISISKYKKARISNPLMLVAAPPKEDFKIWTYNKSNVIGVNEYIEGDVIIY